MRSVLFTGLLKVDAPFSSCFILSPSCSSLLAYLPSSSPLFYPLPSCLMLLSSLLIYLGLFYPFQFAHFSVLIFLNILFSFSSPCLLSHLFFCLLFHFFPLTNSISNHFFSGWFWLLLFGSFRSRLVLHADLNDLLNTTNFSGKNEIVKYWGFGSHQNVNSYSACRGGK